jgi:hypothetical protein
MDDLSRQINKIENRVARYIFLKYIQTIDLKSDQTANASADTLSNDDASSSDDVDDVDDVDDADDADDNLEEVQHVNKEKEKTKNIRPKIDELQFKEFRKNIFKLKRSCFTISQDELIRDDIRTMSIADTAYERNPREFKCSNFDLPPDVLRCSFIRKHHHRYYRCRNKIANNDSDVCKKHEESENIYYDQYNELCEKLTT